ncbi:hypothetical protein KKI90_11760 [Xenorhabdus bovienii]|uniref:hypothetical protein n=1 Tax=Xenorhabdus bovienii TaxID=40576 RepID=UPI00237C6581|nr:hypothetical protein [Xenorhabdus bovienii]MDE9477889.1 hypothetical protein [Xenorhabdus bovienii]
MLKWLQYQGRESDLLLSAQVVDNIFTAACFSTGYAPEEDKPFAQCHTCYGEESALQICWKCKGSGYICR